MTEMCVEYDNTQMKPEDDRLVPFFIDGPETRSYRTTPPPPLQPLPGGLGISRGASTTTILLIKVITLRSESANLILIDVKLGGWYGDGERGGGALQRKAR